MRCIGSILFVFCYIALGDKRIAKTRLQEIAGYYAQIVTMSILFRKTSGGLP